MRAVQIRDYGEVEVLEHVDASVPEPGPQEVRVRVEYAGLRWGDIMQRRGFPTRSRPVPFVGGQEAAGTIDLVGEEVEGLVVGQRVVALPPCGGFAEFVTLDSRRVTPLPDHVPLERSLAYPVNLRTAYLMVYVWARVQPGETVLLHAAAGGVGTMTTQILKRRLDDVTVIGLCGSREKCEIARANGLDHAIDYRERDYVEEVLELTGGPRCRPFDFETRGGGVEVVFNGVSGPTLETDHRVLRRRGRWVIYGWAGGRGVIDTSPFGYYGITIMPFSSLAWTGTQEDLESREFVGEWLATEELIAPTIYPLAEIVEAERALEQGLTTGKVVLEI